jgi:hypothetical protein
MIIIGILPAKIMIMTIDVGKTMSFLPPIFLGMVYTIPSGYLT